MNFTIVTTQGRPTRLFYSSGEAQAHADRYGGEVKRVGIHWRKEDVITFINDLLEQQSPLTLSDKDGGNAGMAPIATGMLIDRLQRTELAVTALADYLSNQSPLGFSNYLKAVNPAALDALDELAQRHRPDR